MTETPMDSLDGFIWMNGALVPWREAKVHFLTHGLHYASSVFEGIRAYNGKPFKLTEHNERLIKSAQMLDMKPDYTVEQLNRAVMETLEKNNLTDAYIRPLVWRGSETMGVYSRNASINVGIAPWYWPSYFGPELMEKGISLCWSDWVRPDPRSLPVQAKASGMYMTGMLSKNKSHDLGYDDALMKDYRGYLAELTGANIFLIVGGEVHTPDPHAFLNGITRQTIIDLARQKGYVVHVRDIMQEELDRADEIFITGTAAEITPVGRIMDKVYTVGPVTRDLRQAYMNLVQG